jgi:hemerythrin-like metal-binding protein
MPGIEWSDEYRLGLPLMDKDHQELVDHCNEYLSAVENDAPLLVLAGILGQLIMRTKAHFIAEERMLDRHGYPGLTQHKAEHDRLLILAETLKARFAEADDDDVAAHQLISETGEFMRHWLLDHIRVNDRPYRPFLRSLS